MQHTTAIRLERATDASRFGDAIFYSHSPTTSGTLVASKEDARTLRVRLMREDLRQAPFKGG
jgi:hypothetical protein